MLNLCIYWFDQTNEFIKVYDGTRCLVLFVSEKYDSTSNRIRYLISVESGITYIIFYNYTKITIIESRLIRLFSSKEAMTFHNIIVLIKSVFDKDKNN